MQSGRSRWFDGSMLRSEAATVEQVEGLLTRALIRGAEPPATARALVPAVER